MATPPTAATRRVTGLLAAAATGVYLLVVVGATTGLLDGAGACATWPACNGAWLPQNADPALLAAWGHRAVTLLVAGLLAATATVAWRAGVRRRTRLAIGAVLVLYPIQIGLGAVTALSGAGTALAAAHLVVGLGLFTLVLVALLWHLEAVTPASEDSAAPVPSTPGPSPAPPDGPPTATERLWGYVRLTKPKLWWLLCLVALAGMALAAGPALGLGTVVPTLVGGVLAIGASGTFNNVLERDVDRRMARTADRPLVAGIVPLWRAVAFGLLLTVASVAVFVAFVNVLAAALGLLAVCFYSVIYTLVLKPHTDQNVAVGGAVGALPALIGWAAVENSVGVPALVLGAVIVLWTPAHFYNLALVYRDDYARADIPMLPVVRGAATTRRHVVYYLGATMLGAVLLGVGTPLGWLYALTVTVFGAVFIWAVVRQYGERTDASAMRAFHASNAYLGTLLVAILVDAMVV